MPAKTSNSPDQSADTPHYHGHRERLRERFHAAGPEALSDYELLEMALFPALPRRDTKPLAKALLNKFGSFAEVIHAPVARLREVDGVGEELVRKAVPAPPPVLVRCRPATVWLKPARSKVAFSTALVGRKLPNYPPWMPTPMGRDEQVGVL